MQSPFFGFSKKKKKIDEIIIIIIIIIYILMFNNEISNLILSFMIDNEISKKVKINL